ncbi:MAG: hypothetical protein NWQ07_03935 [Flaviramulus sp.]|nr:hypothetical protein [Flaviramulus sp.]
MNKIFIKINLLALSFLFSGSALAQQKLTKVSQSINVDKNVVIDLNTSHTNLIIDNWNKNTIEIEAYIEGEKLSKVELEEALKSWKLDIDATSKNVSIKTLGSDSSSWLSRANININVDEEAISDILKELKFELADMPDLNFQMMEISEINFEMPELPEIPEGISAIMFDFDAYKKDGDKYLESYSQKFEKLFGKDYAKKMEAWGEKFGKEWGEKYGKQMEAWAKNFENKIKDSGFEEKMEAWGEQFGEAFGKNMEAWGEQFAKQMESQSKQIEAQAERLAIQLERAKASKVRNEETKARIKEKSNLVKERQKNIEKLLGEKSSSNVKKTIKIKMPKGAKLKVNVRHGEIEFAANIDNLKADLSHSKFTANSVNGSSTSINASYSPVYITNWNLGELNLNYVEAAELKNVKHLVLNTISSNIDIVNLSGSAIVDGNIGDLNIFNIEDTFDNINMILQNNDVVIKLPKVDCNVQFKGNLSKFKHPKKSSKNNSANFTLGESTNGKSIVINAKYSNVVMQ